MRHQSYSGIKQNSAPVQAQIFGATKQPAPLTIGNSPPPSALPMKSFSGIRVALNGGLEALVCRGTVGVFSGLGLMIQLARHLAARYIIAGILAIGTAQYCCQCACFPA